MATECAKKKTEGAEKKINGKGKNSIKKPKGKKEGGLENFRQDVVHETGFWST